MLSNLVMTILSPDRPGVVEIVAECVASKGGNWLESRMSRLGGQFAGIVRVQVSTERLQELLEALAVLDTAGIRVSTHTEPTSAQAQKGVLAQLELIGQDRPGILLQISRILAAHKVNVEELSSEIVNAPMDGSLLFQAKATVLLPPTVSLPAVRADLERIASDLMVDVKLQQAR